MPRAKASTCSAAHLMVNYDLPWNPNRLEQRFGRIHRIGQTEVCHLWNLVADETREGDVYCRLLEKLETGPEGAGRAGLRRAGQAAVRGQAAARPADRGDPVRRPARSACTADDRLENALDHSQLQNLLEERALAHDAMDASRVYRIREEMERAEARRLQPHYIESFFLEAFKRLGGITRQREPRRYEVTHVPAPVRNRDRLIGLREPVLPKYERIAFEKDLLAPPAGHGARGVRVPGPPAPRLGHRPDTGAAPRLAQARRSARGRARRRDRATRCCSTSSTRCRTPA